MMYVSTFRIQWGAGAREGYLTQHIPSGNTFMPIISFPSTGTAINIVRT